MSEIGSLTIETVLKKFVGKIEQVPPMYSAKKIGGKKLYELARQGKTIERKPVEVEIFELKLIADHWPLITLDVHCSSGTYIRALARDIGEALGTGAYLDELRRTAIGPFRIEEAIPLNDLNKETVSSQLKTVSTILSR